MITLTENEYLNLKLYEFAFDNVGVYPASINGVARTEYQDGWNAFGDELQHFVISIYRSIMELEPSVRSACIELIKNDVVFMDESLGDDNAEMVTFYVLANDLFERATADVEVITPSDFEVIADLWNKFDRDGVVAFISVQRENSSADVYFTPLDRYVTQKFIEAREYLNHLNSTNHAES